MAAPLHGKALYDALYAVGYHNNTGIHHGQELLKALKRFRNPKFQHNIQLETGLDVGCSHGAVVQNLWRLGIAAIMPPMAWM